MINMRRWPQGLLIALVVTSCAIITSYVVLNHFYGTPEREMIPEERAIAIAEGALTYWDEQSEAYRTITGEVDSVELCVYHYPVCTPPGKTPPPTLAYNVKFTLENNPHKNYLCENRWVAAKHAVVEVEAYTGKPLGVGYLNPCEPMSIVEAVSAIKAYVAEADNDPCEGIRIDKIELRSPTKSESDFLGKEPPELVWFAEVTRFPSWLGPPPENLKWGGYAAIILLDAYTGEVVLASGND